MYYNVSYYGEDITSGSVHVDVPMVTIDLPAVDSDVSVTVTTMNVFGSGPTSNVAMDEISKLMYACVHTCIYTCMYVCTCTYTYVYVRNIC